jgi:SAM-dependent methyltransferase
MSDTTIHEVVRERYGAIARSAGQTSCCAPSCCGGGDKDAISSDLYSQEETRDLPAEAVTASLGCGNPTALVDLQPGQTVLDLGSGGGIDVLLSARRVGPTGKVYGLDMTDDMLALARANQQRAGAGNVEFLKGQIEAIPLPDDSVDVIISNCVINLSPDKDAVLREAFRVLKPGGRFAVSDVVFQGEVPEDVRRSVDLWTGCVAGALQDDDYARRLTAAGFDQVEIEPWRVYDTEATREVVRAGALESSVSAALLEQRVASAFIRGTNPMATAGHSPS